MNTPEMKADFFKMACLFESSLIVVALILGLIADINPLADLWFSEYSLALGIAGTLPLFMVFGALYQMYFPAMEKIKQLMLDTMGGSMHKLHWGDLFVLAVIAGISEELLFRGVLQPWIEQAWGWTAGLLISNILFGLVHAVTPLYALLAGLVGIYLGLSLDYGGVRNLMVPMVIHGFYDFIAFLVIIRLYRQRIQS